MEARSLLFLKHIMEIAAAIVGILAAWFEFRDRAQTKEERAKTREIYSRKWITIRNSGLLDLPERVIGLLLKVVRVVSSNAFDKFQDLLPAKLLYLLMFVGMPFYVATASWLRIGWVGLLVLGAPSAVLMLVLFLNAKNRIDIPEKLETLFILAFAALIFAGTVIWLDIALGFHIAYALVIMSALFPVLVVFLGASMYVVADVVDDVQKIDINVDKWGFVGMATAASFSITLLSLLLGSIALPTSWVPKTIQMIASNVVCDGLTMYATLVILSFAVRPKKRLPIPVAVALDITVGAILACASLYFGLIFTDHALSIGEVCRVLAGLSPTGDSFEIGPYFWAMHTSFFPTLCYISLIFFCWLGKLFVLPIAAILSKGRAVEKPHHLTAGALLLLLALFAALAAGLGALE